MRDVLGVVLGLALGIAVTLGFGNYAARSKRLSEAAATSLPPTTLLVGSLAEPVASPYSMNIKLSQLATCVYLDREEMLVLSENLDQSGDLDAMVIRGYAGTVSAPHAAGTVVYKGLCESSKSAR